MKQTFLFILVTTFLLVQTSCIKTDTSSAAGSSLPDPNGPWLITIPQGDHCFAPASTNMRAGLISLLLLEMALLFLPVVINAKSSRNAQSFN